LPPSISWSMSPSSVKRKYDSFESSDSSDSGLGEFDILPERPPDSTDLNIHRNKRLRHRGLEHGLASLSLGFPYNQSLPPTSYPSPHYSHRPSSDGAPIPTSSYRDPHLYSQSNKPYSIASAPLPTPINLDIQREDPPIDDVPMKKQSWYEREKDRIVLLDLDSSDEEGDSTPQKSSSSASSEPSYEISPAALAALPSILRPLKSIPESDSRALILFRPSPWAPPPEKVETTDVDDDRMDIEY